MRRREYPAFALIFAFKLISLELAGVVIEPEAAALNEGDIGEAVVFVYFHKTVLEILRVCELPAVYDTCFEKKCAAGESVKIRTCNQSHYKFSSCTIYDIIDKNIINQNYSNTLYNNLK